MYQFYNACSSKKVNLTSVNILLDLKTKQKKMQKSNTKYWRLQSFTKTKQKVLVAASVLLLLIKAYI